MFHYYKCGEEFFFSLNEEKGYEGLIPVQNIPKSERLFFLQGLIGSARRKYLISEASMLFETEETLANTILPKESGVAVPCEILSKINECKVTAINTAHPGFLSLAKLSPPKKWRVTVVGLGDVGANLIIGLRLLGEGIVSEIGIFSPEENGAKRLEMEINQIYRAFSEEEPPRVEIIQKEQLMEGDMFIFAASKGVPPLDTKIQDVRLVQYRGNAEILSEYAKMARDAAFRGIFAVVSDPVDQLCLHAYSFSNIDENGIFDGKGLGGEQVHGFGLGVMNARALYFSKLTEGASAYEKKGRAYGPHGEGLVIANNIESYDEEVSGVLTEHTIKANLEVRALGFKPYIAPAFSSGALSLIALMRGEWHYSSVLIDGAFLGIKNRETPCGVEVERVSLPKPLFEKIGETHRWLKGFKAQ